MVHLIARIVGIGVETPDMLVNEVFSCQFRDRKAVARYGGLTIPSEHLRSAQLWIFATSSRPLFISYTSEELRDPKS